MKRSYRSTFALICVASILGLGWLAYNAMGDFWFVALFVGVYLAGEGLQRLKKWPWAKEHHEENDDDGEVR